MSAPIYTQEIADRVCAGLSEGNSLKTVCGEIGIHPQRVFEWLRTKEDFLAQYNIAKEESADVLTEQMLDIADDLSDDAQSRRVRVDTRKWIASKLKPKKYGDKVEQNVKHGLDDDLTRLLQEIDGKSRTLPR
jgi:hypothetical protein